MFDKVVDSLQMDLKHRFQNESTGHDYWHTLRVFKRAKFIQESMGVGDYKVVALGALMHDVADHKFGYTDEDRKAIITEVLQPYGIDESLLAQVVVIANSISYKGGQQPTDHLTIEAKIVQDADRLDALGAIGIARTFAFGGLMKRPLYTPDGGNDSGDSISHFYQKLLKLKDLMHTPVGLSMAQARHARLQAFLDQFFEEWNA